MTMRIYRSATPGFAKDFQDFAIKGNIFDLAVGVIIGGALGKIVTNFVESILMPLISVLIPGGSWRETKLVLGMIPDPQHPGMQIENAILVGQFLAGMLDFTIIAVVIFLMIRAMAKVKRKEQRLDAVDSKECSYCLSIVPIEASKCAHCTSDLPLAM